ncbi:MAG: response regulator transcription factor [Anaerolineaceae bacterium]|nr:response regulator transcription factor [Anaerolineaceae bacterium]
MGTMLFIVDDDDLFRRSLSFSLDQAGFETHSFATAEDGIAAAHQKRPALVLLDVMLPGMDGLEALRYFHDKLNVPVIFLTARRREVDQIVGLELGADDYLPKPFDTDVLIAHIKAVLRRTRGTFTPEQGPIELKVGDLFINSKSHTVTVAGKPVELTAKEFDLLFALAVEPERVFTIDELLSRVWGAEFHGQPQIVYVNIRWLRQKIEPDPAQPTHLISIRGAGYKLTATGQNGA